MLKLKAVGTAHNKWAVLCECGYLNEFEGFFEPEDIDVCQNCLTIFKTTELIPYKIALQEEC